jgi:hypothetical protein
MSSNTSFFQVQTYGLIVYRSRRILSHASSLLNLISQFPVVNPSVSTEDESASADIPKLFRQIHSRYRLLCASLGVRPSLRSVSSGEDEGSLEHALAQDKPKKGSVWPTTRNDDLNF